MLQRPIPTAHEEVDATEEIGRLLRAQPATAIDGLVITVEQARSLPPKLMESVYGVKGLDDVVVVAPGRHKRPPRRCNFYLRIRKSAGDRVNDVVELVVKRPGRANPFRFSLKASPDELDEARLEALILLAQKSGRKRRGSSWTIEDIENLLVADVIKVWKRKHGYDRPETESLPVQRAPGERGGAKTDAERRATAKLHTYRSKLESFERVFPDLCVGDIDESIPGEYERRVSNRSPTTLPADLSMAKKAINEGLRTLGVRGYRVDFVVKAAPRVPKVIWTPIEFDRILAAADGYVFNPDGTPLLVDDGAGGELQKRRPDSSVRARKAWRRAIPLLALTGSRNGLLTKTMWTNPHGSWISVIFERVIWFRKGWLGPQDSPKRGEPVFLPEPLAKEVRAWCLEDLRAGIPYVFYKANGKPYKNGWLDRRTFERIVQDAGVARKVLPHHFKDLTIQIATAVGVQRRGLAAWVSTSPEMLEKTYGPEVDWGSLVDTACRMSDLAPWREMFAALGDMLPLTAERQRLLAEASEHASTGG